MTVREQLYFFQNYFYVKTIKSQNGVVSVLEATTGRQTGNRSTHTCFIVDKNTAMQAEGRIKTGTTWYLREDIEVQL